MENFESIQDNTQAKYRVAPKTPPNPPNPPKPPRKTQKKPWNPSTCLIVGDCTLNGLSEGRMSKNKTIVVRSSSGAVVGDFYNYLEPLMEKKPSRLIIHAGTNDSTEKDSNEILDELLQLRDYVKLRFDIDAVISCPTIKMDSNKGKKTVQELSRKLDELKIPTIFHKNVDEDCLEKGGKFAGLHLTPKGIGRMAINFISYNRKN